MAESRLVNLGTVFTRVKGLIRGGALKWEDRPVWYDVYRAFPPKLNPVHDRPPVMKEVVDIMYPEDIIRAEFFKRFVSPGVINLATQSGQTLVQRFVDNYLDLAKFNSIPREELFQATLDRMAAQGTVFPGKRVPSEQHADASRPWASASVNTDIPPASSSTQTPVNN